MISRLLLSRSSGLLLAIATALSCPTTFAGQGDPVSIFVGETLTQDDNVFRAPVAFVKPVSDSIQTRYAGLLFDTDLHRQHLHAEIIGNDVRYGKLSYLDNTGSRYQVAWQGQLGNKTKADASWNRSQSLAGFADFRSTIKNIVIIENSMLRLQRAITPDWSVVASVRADSSINGAAANAVSDSTAKTAESGFQYDAPRGNRSGILVRTTLGNYPNRQFVPGLSLVDNSYRQQDFEGYARWAATGRSQLEVRAAETRRDHNDVPQRNFKGVTGSAYWDWIPTAKSGLNAYIRRELGAAEYLQANYAVVEAIGISPRWSPTAKLTFQGQLENRKRTFGGDPDFIVSGTPVAGDRLRLASMSAQYAATRWLQLTLSAKHEVRDSSDPTFAYDSNVYSLTAQVTF